MNIHEGRRLVDTKSRELRGAPPGHSLLVTLPEAIPWLVPPELDTVVEDVRLSTVLSSLYFHYFRHFAGAGCVVHGRRTRNQAWIFQPR